MPCLNQIKNFTVMELIKGLRLKKQNVIILKNDDHSFCLSIFYKNCMYRQYYSGLTINESLDKFIIYVKKFQNNHSNN